MYTLDNEHKAFEMLTWGRKLSTIVTIVSFLAFHVSFWGCCTSLDIFTIFRLPQLKTLLCNGLPGFAKPWLHTDKFANLAGFSEQETRQALERNQDFSVGE